MSSHKTILKKLRNKRYKRIKYWLLIEKYYQENPIYFGGLYHDYRQ